VSRTLLGKAVQSSTVFSKAEKVNAAASRSGIPQAVSDLLTGWLLSSVKGAST